MAFSTDMEERVRELLPELQEVNSKRIVYEKEGRIKSMTPAKFKTIFIDSLRASDPALYLYQQENKHTFTASLEELLSDISSELKGKNEESLRKQNSVLDRLSDLIPCVDLGDRGIIVLVERLSYKINP